MKLIDMEALKEYNPKLHAQIAENPQHLLELQNLLIANEAQAKVEMATQAMQTAAENLQYKPPKVYSLPFLWAYFAPVFSFTAVSIPDLLSFNLGLYHKIVSSNCHPMVSIHYPLWVRSQTHIGSSHDQINGAYQ